MDTPKTKKNKNCHKIRFTISHSKNCGCDHLLPPLSSRVLILMEKKSLVHLMLHREKGAGIPVFCSSGILSLTIICITVVLPSGRDRAKGEREKGEESKREGEEYEGEEYESILSLATSLIP